MSRILHVLCFSTQIREHDLGLEEVTSSTKGFVEYECETLHVTDMNESCHI